MNKTLAVVASGTSLTAKMASVVERMARAGHPSLDQLTPDEAKASYEKGAGVLEVPKPDLARIEDFSIAARDGFELPARLYAPSSAKLPVLVYFHGGGFTVGNIRTHDTLCRVLSGKAAARWCRSTTGWRPRTSFRRLRTTPGMRSPLLRTKVRASASIPAGSRWAATAPAARWPRCAPFLRATRACRSRCRC
jgi:hypothetical protein